MRRQKKWFVARLIFSLHKNPKEEVHCKANHQLQNFLQKSRPKQDSKI